MCSVCCHWRYVPSLIHCTCISPSNLCIIIYNLLWMEIFICLFIKRIICLYIYLQFICPEWSRLIMSLSIISVLFLELPRIQGNGKMCFSQVSLNTEHYIICLMIGLYTALKLLKEIIFSELHVNTGVYIYMYAREYFEFKIWQFISFFSRILDTKLMANTAPCKVSIIQLNKIYTIT